jgi:hypothetical protein
MVKRVSLEGFPRKPVAAHAPGKPRRGQAWVKAGPYNGPVSKDMIMACLLWLSDFGGNLSRMYASLLIGAMLAEDPKVHEWSFLEKMYPVPPQQEEDETEPQAKPARKPVLSDQQAAAYLLHHHAASLSAKEKDFLTGISTWSGRLSERQLKWLVDIADRVDMVFKRLRS